MVAETGRHCKRHIQGASLPADTPGLSPHVFANLNANPRVYKSTHVLLEPVEDIRGRVHPDKAWVKHQNKNLCSLCRSNGFCWMRRQWKRTREQVAYRPGLLLAPDAVCPRQRQAARPTLRIWWVIYFVGGSSVASSE